MDDTSYKGASLSAKELLSWRPLRHSADVELDGELSTLVARSRDLIRNNGIASGAIQTLVDNVIGNGLKLVSIPDHRILGLDLDYLEEWARKVESLWRIWSESVYCDAARKLNFNSQTALIFRSVIENGEALALVLWRENQANQFATCFQLIEPDRLSNPDFKQNTEFLRDGIEINHYGEPQNYWISKYYPNDYYYHGNTNSWEKVAAQTSFGRKLILHIHHPERIGQNRGKPLFTSIMPLFKMLDTLAEVFINKIATYRDTSTETVIKDFGQGDVFVGKKAIWQGLANRQSSFERILTDLNKERENENMNEMEIRQQERQRMKEVFDNAEAQGREQIANKMLVTTDLSSSQIIEILKDMPKQQVVSSFEKVMAQIPNPEIVVSGTETAENVEVMAKRIASLANKSSSGE